jgi:hypothetical protein
MLPLKRAGLVEQDRLPGATSSSKAGLLQARRHHPQRLPGRRPPHDHDHRLRASRRGHAIQLLPDDPEVFEKEIAPARTFCFLREVKMLQDQGLIRGGSLENAVVIGDESILNDELRYPDEFVRHKILDLLGDMYLLGRPIKGHFIGMKSGHPSHVAFSKQIKKALLNGHTRSIPRPDKGVPPDARRQHDHEADPPPLPFLLVDRIINFVPHERVIGIKNVTANEPFFQGHWPNLPVMPAVLIMEVMAQVSSPLLFDGNPESRRYPFFLGHRQGPLPQDRRARRPTRRRGRTGPHAAQRHQGQGRRPCGRPRRRRSRDALRHPRRPRVRLRPPSSPCSKAGFRVQRGIVPAPTSSCSCSYS